MIFSLDLFILANKFKNDVYFFLITISRGTPIEKPCSRVSCLERYRHIDRLSAFLECLYLSFSATVFQLSMLCADQ
jgi:hypothetical protein